MVLNNYAVGITERINIDALHDENNEFVKVLDGTVGEYLTNRNNHFLDVFLATASSDFLDLHGKLFSLFRRENESDDEFRQRIILDNTIVQSTSDFLKLNIGLWVYRDGVTDNNTLTTRNTYLKDEHDDDYVFLATGIDSEYIQSKFLGVDILWVE